MILFYKSIRLVGVITFVMVFVIWVYICINIGIDVDLRMA